MSKEANSMSTESSTDDFDWVTAHSTCTIETMFRRLQLGAQKDVDRRNGLTGRHDHWRFALTEEENGFEVLRSPGSQFSTGQVDAFVVFERVGPRINIRGDGIELDITAIIGINPAGDCRYFVGEAEYLEWEVRKLALDQLFFEEPAE